MDMPGTRDVQENDGSKDKEHPYRLADYLVPGASEGSACEHQWAAARSRFHQTLIERVIRFMDHYQHSAAWHSWRN